MNQKIIEDTTSEFSTIPEGEKSEEQSNRQNGAGTVSENPPILKKETAANDKFVTTPVKGSAFGADELVPLQKMMSGVDMMDIKTVEKEIGKACKVGAKNSEIAVKASVLVATNAWVTGKLIVRAKSILRKKGEFGNWCEDKLVKPGLMSVKTAQRYMSIAKKWDSLDGLLAGVPNLWSAYQQAGVLPVQADDDDAQTPEITEALNDATGAPPVSNVAEYVAELSKLQKMLRRLGEMRPRVAPDIPEAEQQKIELIIDQIFEFAIQLRGKSA